MKGLNAPVSVQQQQQVFGFEDHFVFKNTSAWSQSTNNSGTFLVTSGAGGAGGVLVISTAPSTPVLNNENYIFTPGLFKIASQKPITFSALLNFAQASTNQAQIIAGLMSGAGAASLQDGALGPKANFSGAVFFTKPGGLNWWVCYSDGTTQTILELTAAASLNKTVQVAASTTDTLLTIDIVPKTSTLVDIIFRINGSTVAKMLDKTYASAVEASIIVGSKLNNSTNQTLNVNAAAAYAKV